MSTSIQYSVGAQVIVNPQTKTKKVISNDTTRISGGIVKGKFILHSFKEFSLSPNKSVLFLNPFSKETILARVTGGKVSNISGTLGTQGNANLIFVNPNGFKFGRNASLNLGGSFLASTANDFEINNDKLILDYSSNQESISIEGDGHNVIFPGDPRLSFFFNGPQPQGLQISPTNSLSLISGNISYNGGVTVSPSGTTNLFAINTGQAVVSHSSNGLDVKTRINSHGDINLTNRAFINTSGYSQGSVYVNADNLKISDGSLIYSESLGTQSLGEIQINASDILIDGITASTPLFPFTFNSFARGIVSLSNQGTGPDINISGNSLTLLNQGVISANAEGQARGANININVEDQVRMDGATPFNPFLPVGSEIQALSRSDGDSGDIQLSANDLFLTEGSHIISITLGNGNGGDIKVDINNQTKLEGFTPFSNIASLISTISVGNSSKQNSGNGGKLEINTKSLLLERGGRIDASTLGDGNSGSIEVNADSIVIQGRIPDDESSQIIAASDNVNNFLRNIFELEEPTGDSGSINITARSLSISDFGSVNVRADGSGDAGVINIQADTLDLSNQGNIGASTNSGDGGNIFLDTNRLSLSNSSISSNARGAGVGGNIEINSGLSTLNEQSVVEANAQNNIAGNIEWNTNTLLVSPDSKVTVTSERGANFNGRIEADIQNTQVRTVRLSPVQQVDTDISKICGFDGNRLSATSKAQVAEMTTDSDLLAAWSIYTKYEQYKGRFFRDAETQEIKPIRPVLALEYLDDGRVHPIYSPEESKHVSNLLSSLKRKCNKLQKT